jgi:AcrR family transcriptional regulator
MPRVSPEYLQHSREKIVRAARTLFATRGFRATSMEDIAHDVGVTKGALYRYFNGKSELLRAVRDSSRAGVVAEIDEALSNEDFLDVFVRFLDRALNPEGEARQRFGFETLAEAAIDRDLRKTLLEDQRRGLRATGSIVARLKREGRVDASLDTDAAAFAHIALSLEAALLVFLGYDRKPTLRAFRQALELVYRPPPKGSPRRATLRAKGVSGP